MLYAEGPGTDTARAGVQLELSGRPSYHFNLDTQCAWNILVSCCWGHVSLSLKCVYPSDWGDLCFHLSFLPRADVGLDVLGLPNS